MHFKYVKLNEPVETAKDDIELGTIQDLVALAAERGSLVITKDRTILETQLD